MGTEAETASGVREKAPLCREYASQWPSCTRHRYSRRHSGVGWQQGRFSSVLAVGSV